MATTEREVRAHVGRPRDESLTQRILQAARDELAASGVDNFSIRQVAQRAGVTRKAVSVRWPDAEGLLRAALGAIDELQFEATGDLARDLTELGALFISGLTSGALDLQLRVTADAPMHPDVYAELQRRVEMPMSRALGRTFRAAQATGQVREGDVIWLVRAFVGSLLATTFGQPNRAAPSAEQLADLVSEVCTWAAAPPLASRAGDTQ